MRVLYSEVVKRTNLNEKTFSEFLKIIPEKVFLAYTIQYKELAKELKKRLGKRVIGFQQVVGCSTLQKQSTIILIGEARFHALRLLKFAEKVLVFDGQSFNELGEKDKKEQENMNRIKFTNLLNSKNVGILVSTKLGQYHFDNVLDIKEKLNNLSDKKSYVFLSDTFTKNELENFKIDFWINTACTGITYDNKKIINQESFLELTKK